MRDNLGAFEVLFCPLGAGEKLAYAHIRHAAGSDIFAQRVEYKLWNILPRTPTSTPS